MAESTQKKTQAIDVVSMGCRLNGYESEKMAVLAKEAGLENSVIINSCAVTNEAVRQTRQKIRQLRKSDPAANIIVTGCAAQIDPKSFSEMDEVNAVIGNGEKLAAKSWEAIKQEPEKKFSVTDIMEVTQIPVSEQLLKPDVKPGRTRAYIQIQNGCDHRCTFCIIPYGRGNSRSVPVEYVIEEVRGLVAAGTSEVVLTGVDITSYGPDLPGEPTLGTLVRRILTDVPDLPRLRLSSIDGAEIDEELFMLITSEERIAPHLHLSLQAGDNMILKRMKRRHSREQAIEFCRRIKEKRPDVVFGADIIAGFPTETEEMFENSLRLVEECDLTYLHVFPFSPRIGTPAARMPQLERSVIKERAARLRAIGDAALMKKLDEFIGQTHSVLVERPSTEDGKNNRGKGRLANFAEVKFDLRNHPPLKGGQFCQVTLTHHDDRVLYGALTEGFETRE